MKKYTLALITFAAALSVTSISHAAFGPIDESWQAQYDLRFRSDYLERGTSTTYKPRFRGRFALSKKVDEQLKLYFRLATGSANNPVSTNFDLGGSGARKEVRVDWVYFSYSPYDILTIDGGKMRNALIERSPTQLIFDTDWSPEGLILRWGQKEDAPNLLLSAFYLRGKETGTTNITPPITSDALIYSALLTFKLDDETSGFTFGLGTHITTGLADEPVLVNSDGNFQGNRSYPVTSDPFRRYAHEFRMGEVFLNTFFGDSTFKLSPFVHAAQNFAVGDAHTAWAAGIGFGVMDWTLTASYRDVQAKSVIAALNDSDYAGGWDDNRGLRLNLARPLSPTIVLSLDYSNAEIRNNTYPRAERFLVDLEFSNL